MDKKGKAVPMLHLISTCREDVWGTGGITPPFFSLALNESEW
jgi:hypothetical protein